LIGFDSGAGGGGGLDPETIRDKLDDLWNDVVDFIQDIAEAIWSWVETVIDFFRWVRVFVQEIYGVPMERWNTRHDERTCPQCGGLDGQVWERNEGEYPPAHDNCRCTRDFAYTDWRTRTISTWQRQHEQIITGEWQITGWT
jgi:hypothetical protein